MTTGSIVLDVCKKHRVKPDDFFNPKKRTKKMGRVRNAAIKALLEAGFNYAAIARLTRLNYSTIQYWTHPEYRKRRVKYFRNLRLQRKMEAELYRCPADAAINEQMVAA